MNSQECRGQLIELLRAQTERIVGANTLLVGIRLAIAENRFDTLRQSLDQPAFAVEEIEQLEQQRLQLLERFGFARKGSALTECIAWCDDAGGEVSQIYAQLIQDLMALQRSIQLNSLLVRKGQERVRRSIGVLTGLGNGGHCETYSSQGRTEETGAGRDIAIA